MNDHVDLGAGLAVRDGWRMTPQMNVVGEASKADDAANCPASAGGYGG